MNSSFHFKASVHWALVFVAKVLLAVAVIDVAVFPILWILRVALPQAYTAITCCEGICIVLIGCLLLFSSLLSTIKQANDRYVGFGSFRIGFRYRKLAKEEKYVTLKRGILMVIIGVLLFLPTLVILDI